MTVKKSTYFLALIVTLLFSGISQAQQTAKISPAGTGYLEYLPQGYSSNTNNYPVIIFLHGKGEKGTTSTNPDDIKASLSKVTNVAIPKYIKYGQQYPFILISPQLKSSYGTWPANYVMEVVNHVRKYLRIDPKRIYLTGLSLGGYGVWTTVGSNPQTFAAIASVCAGGSALSKACNIASENVAAWGFHGDADGMVSYTVTTKMINAINACATKPNPLAKVTIYPGMGHAIWDKTYKESGVLDWLLKFTNEDPAPLGSTTTTTTTNALPVVSAGGDKTITLPTNSTYMQGTASDSDGSIAYYQWSKVSGSTATLSGATTSKLTVSNLVSGTYKFRLTVKDNKGASRYDEVYVKVTSSTSTTNTVSSVSAGSNKTLYLPTNWTYLPGSASDPDGIASYKWTKVSGSTAVLKYADTYRVNVSSLVAGTYVFRLTVTDKKGATRYDDVMVYVRS
jgi:dienelactone hydrolase